MHIHINERTGKPGALTDDDARGGGVLLYVGVDDVAAVHRRAVDQGADVVSAPTFIDLAGHTEFLVRDPDGYTLAVTSPGDVSGA